VNQVVEQVALDSTYRIGFESGALINMSFPTFVPHAVKSKTPKAQTRAVTISAIPRSRSFRPTTTTHAKRLRLLDFPRYKRRRTIKQLTSTHEMSTQAYTFDETEKLPDVFQNEAIRSRITL
jgi:hypothetical protein